MTEPLRNHGDHGGATAVYAVQAPQWHRASGVTGYTFRNSASGDRPTWAHAPYEANPMVTNIRSF